MGIALLWNRTLDDYTSPLENISSDPIVGIQWNFPNKNLLFIPGVYLPVQSYLTLYLTAAIC